MDIVKIAAAGVITAVCALILRETRADMAIAVTLAGGVIILLMVLDKVVGIFTVFETLMQRAGIDNRIFSLLVKIIASNALPETGELRALLLEHRSGIARRVTVSVCLYNRHKPCSGGVSFYYAEIMYQGVDIYLGPCSVQKFQNYFPPYTVV